jgi:hypothetical protein
LPKHTSLSFAKTDSVAKKHKLWHIIFKNKWSWHGHLNQLGGVFQKTPENNSVM